MAEKKMPSHEAKIAIVTKEGSKDPRDVYWMRIGAAWWNRDGKSLTVVLNALPPDGRFVLQVPYDKKDDDPSGDANGS